MIQETMEFISQYDPEVGASIQEEFARERRNIELIASENLVSKAVMLAMGTCLTNKYAEGYPGKRYYGGCYAVLQPGDTVLSMSLAHGGHLSHGSPVNISGKYFHIVPYGVEDDTEVIDYDRVLELAKECRPKLIVAGASAYPRLIDFARFREIADAVGAYLQRRGAL